MNEEEIVTEQVAVETNNVDPGVVRPSWTPGVILVVALIAIYVFWKMRKK